MKQRTSEWIELVDTEYHERQLIEPYRSTVAFCDWLETCGYLSPNTNLKLLDLCCGQGGNVHYLAKRYPNATIVGADINSAIVQNGNSFFKANNIQNCRLEVADIFDLPSTYANAFDAVISLQTLSWFREFKEPLAAMSRLNADWMAVSSLFYDGPVSCTIEVQEYDEALSPWREKYYNVYSLPVVAKHLQQIGYPEVESKPFEIDIDLSPPTSKLMGTYTKELAEGSRLQISGPLLMPWHFVGARKDKRVASGV